MGKVVQRNKGSNDPGGGTSAAGDRLLAAASHSQLPLPPAPASPNPTVGVAGCRAALSEPPRELPLSRAGVTHKPAGLASPSAAPGAPLQEQAGSLACSFGPRLRRLLPAPAPAWAAEPAAALQGWAARLQEKVRCANASPKLKAPAPAARGGPAGFPQPPHASRGPLPVGRRWVGRRAPHSHGSLDSSGPPELHGGYRGQGWMGLLQREHGDSLLAQAAAAATLGGGG